MPTKKDFIAVAAIVANVKAGPASADFIAGAEAAKAAIAAELADLYTRQNPNFQRARFLAACGVKAEA